MDQDFLLWKNLTVSHNNKSHPSKIRSDGPNQNINN
jgi:hypothetical protein